MDEPAFDIYETRGTLVLEIALPGVLETDIDLTLEENLLIVQAERAGVEGTWVHRELRRGRLARQIPLPGPVEIARALFDDGVLRLELRRLDA